MTSIAIRTEEGELGQPQFRAVAGSRESVGRTMGEALDALTADWGEEIHEAVVIIPRFQPDAHFTEAQHSRMQELLARRGTLTATERAELEDLVDAELDATMARADSLIPQRQP